MKDKYIISWLEWMLNDINYQDDYKLPNWARINIKELIEEIKK